MIHLEMAALSERIWVAIERQSPPVRAAIHKLIKAQKIGTRLLKGDKGAWMVSLVSIGAPATALGVPLLVTDLRTDELSASKIRPHDVRLN